MYYENQIEHSALCTVHSKYILTGIPDQFLVNVLNQKGGDKLQAHQNCTLTD